VLLLLHLVCGVEWNFMQVQDSMLLTMVPWEMLKPMIPKYVSRSSFSSTLLNKLKRSIYNVVLCMFV